MVDLARAGTGENGPSTAWVDWIGRPLRDERRRGRTRHPLTNAHGTRPRLSRAVDPRRACNTFPTSPSPPLQHLPRNDVPCCGQQPAAPSPCPRACRLHPALVLPTSCPRPAPDLHRLSFPLNAPSLLLSTPDNPFRHGPHPYPLNCQTGDDQVSFEEYPHMAYYARLRYAYIPIPSTLPLEMRGHSIPLQETRLVPSHSLRACSK